MVLHVRLHRYLPHVLATYPKRLSGTVCQDARENLNTTDAPKLRYLTRYSYADHIPRYVSDRVPESRWAASRIDSQAVRTS